MSLKHAIIKTFKALDSGRQAGNPFFLELQTFNSESLTIRVSVDKENFVETYHLKNEYTHIITVRHIFLTYLPSEMSFNRIAKIYKSKMLEDYFTNKVLIDYKICLLIHGFGGWIDQFNENIKSFAD